VPPQRQNVRRGADKSLAFPIFLLAVQPQKKKNFLDGLKKFHKFVELSGEYAE
jgi:hypothetical protein